MLRRVVGFLLLLLACIVPAIAQLPSAKLLAMVDAHAYQDFPKREDILAVIEIESKFDPKAHGLGGRGLMQVRGGSLNPKKNLEQGIGYLRDMFLLFGSEHKAFLAYNAGPGRVMQGKGKGLRNAAKYLKKVLAVRSFYVVKAEPENLSVSEPETLIILDPDP